MADTSNLTSFLGDIADAIRTKKETIEEIPAANFDQEILSIETGANTSDATATKDQILEGETAYIAEGKVTGTMPDTGVAEKILQFPANLDEVINQAFPTNVTTIALYGIAFTNDGKYCARLVQSGGVFKLGLYTVSEDGLTLTLMKKKEDGVEVDALYTLSGDASTGLIDGDADSSSVSELARFVMVPNSFDNIYDCRLYIRGNNGTYRWNSLIRIDFESDTPITDADIFKFNSGSGVSEYSIIPVPGHTDRCVQLVYINSYRLDLYLCSIDYESKAITRISSVFELNARNSYTAVYDFSNDGRSMIISQPNGNSVDNNPYAPYIVRFAEDFNSMKTTQCINGNPGVVCLNADGTLAFTNGKLFSIVYGSGTTMTVSRVGTTDVISPFHTRDNSIGRARTYFSYDNQRIIYCYDSGVRVYKIDLTGTTTTSSYSPSISATLCFHTQSVTKEFVYTQATYTSGVLYKIGPNGTKELLGLTYKGVSYMDISGGNATSSDLLSGKTAYANNQLIAGTMPNNGALNYSVSTSTQSIPAGYTSGGTVAAASISESGYSSALLVANDILGTTIEYDNWPTLPVEVEEFDPRYYSIFGTVASPTLLNWKGFDPETMKIVNVNQTNGYIGIVYSSNSQLVSEARARFWNIIDGKWQLASWQPSSPDYGYYHGEENADKFLYSTVDMYGCTTKWIPDDIIFAKNV